jgi:hypothetical protein
VKQAVRIPVIASLNGHSGESWLKFARIIEQAGADALEFNFYDVPAALSVSSAALEENLVSAVKNLTHAIAIPVAVKLTPVLHLVWPRRRSARSRRRERAGAVQPVLSVERGHAHRRPRAAGRALHERGARAAPALAGAAARTGAAVAGGHRRRCHP